jgi:hypothetical protein
MLSSIIWSDLQFILRSYEEIWLARPDTRPTVLAKSFAGGLMDILEQHFDWDKYFDERYHCKHCSYDTQLPNAAMRHFVKQHEAGLVLDEPAPTPDEEEQIQEQEKDNFILESEK